MEKICKKFNIALTLFLLMFFLFKVNYSVEANDKVVKAQKTWTIKLNMKVDPSTVKDNVTVIDEKCNTIPAEVYLWKLDEKFIIIDAPKEEYDSNKIYYIVLNKGLKSIYGDNLNKRMVYKFYVEDKEADFLYNKIETGLKHHVNKVYIRPEEQEKALKIAKKVVENHKGKTEVTDIGIGENLNDKTSWISFQYDIKTFWGYCEENEFVTINLNSRIMPVGEFNFLNVNSNIPGSKITYDVKDKNILSIDENGNIRALNAGKTFIYVNYSYRGTYKSYSIPIEVINNK